MPPAAYMYALPHEYYEKHHVRKYGFHGTSVKYLVGEVRTLAMLCKTLQDNFFGSFLEIPAGQIRPSLVS